ncbi:hypothetical protein GO009_02640 [Muricauda sp. TY007]|uniref:hypothetical protein n=1 Tax=Allomuricauda sp. TY007 TaxID=2683200 RepID=UPI0013C062B0|nr:hypothetical protein [Muricauda sp. TY007]NDV14911.1 hypothetical protein [Muricauda sp. TY007]
MKKFYSIVKIVTDMTVNDSISTGIIVNDGTRLLFKFSDYKKSIAKRLFQSDSDDIDFAIKQLEKRIEEINKSINLEGTIGLFDLTEYNSQLKSDYFTYLNAYTTGLIQFGSPKLILDSHSIDLDKLFKLYVDPVEHIKDNKGEEDLLIIKSHVQKRLISKVEERIHTNIKIDSNLISDIIFPYELDCIGMNGSLVGAKSLSFEHSHQTVDKYVSHYITLITSLSYKYSKSLKDNRFYLIANEPKDVKSETYKIWDRVYNNKLIDILHPDQSDIVAERVFETNATKFLN